MASVQSTFVINHLEFYVFKATVLSLIPATLAMVGTSKTTLAEAQSVLGCDSLTIALRDNGPKVNGTLVFLEGTVGQIGDAVNAVSARNKVKYGPHLILGVVTFVDGKMKIRADIRVDESLKAALFQVESTEAVTADEVQAVEVAVEAPAVEVAVEVPAADPVVEAAEEAAA